MKKPCFLLGALCLLSLASCNGANEPLINVYEEDSMIVGTDYGSADSYALATYRHKNFGTIPFVELGQFVGFFKSDVVTAPTVSKIADHLYAVNKDGIVTMLVNAKTDTITVKRFDVFLSALTRFNNGIALDSASPDPSDKSLVHPSSKSKVKGEYLDEVYNLGDYHMDIAEAGGKVYLPFQFLSNLFMRTLGGDFLYNGHDYFISTLSGVNAASCYSGNNTFYFKGVLFEQTEVTPTGEFRRYVAKDPSILEGPAEYTIFALSSDGKGASWDSEDPQSPIPENPNNGLLVWEMLGQDVKIGLKIMNETTHEFNEVPSYFRVRHDQTLFNAKTRDRTVANYNYNLLRFQFDRLYGLKPELAEKTGYIDFDSFVSSKGLKEGLLSLDVNTYDAALCDFTMRYVDDGHTKYTQRSLGGITDEKDAATLVKEHPGARRGGLFEKLSAYQSKRTEVLGNQDPIGVFMEGETAVIRFDSFVHVGGNIPVIPSEAKEYPISTIMQLSTPWGFDLCFDQINANPAIENVVIDLTCNGGGMVLTLPYLAAHFTKDPIFLNYDACQGVEREFHYSVDLNHNGVYGDEGDSYVGKYNFFVLTSDFSFSCGSALPTIAHIAGVKLIGKQCGGGACTVATFTDAFGSIYTTSSPGQIGYRDAEGKFVNDDAGIPVDYALGEDSWYDLGKLNTFVSGLINA